MNKRKNMTRIAALSAAAMLLAGCTSSSTVSPSAETLSDSAYAAELEALKKENAELQARLEQQKLQIKELQDDLLALMGSEEYMAAADPSGEDTDARIQALDTFAAISEAYADFDREKLEELIPKMDEQLAYLTPEMLNNYYMILEYVEQPSNG